MKKLLPSFFWIAFLIVHVAFAQVKSQINFSKVNTVKEPTTDKELAFKRTCGTMENLALQLKQDPTLEIKLQEQEVETQKRISDLVANSSNKVSTVYKIAVVVHVVYSNATENVSDAQIYSQIAALNRDYRKQNTDINLVPPAFSGLAADVEIEFCLASLDPNGVPTNGITRTSTSNTGGFSNSLNDVKADATDGKSPWNTSLYMNLWVCNLQGQLLGYAQFPGTGLASTDGIVIDYAYFGTNGTATAPFNQGRTATHEVGHYLNLRHIWGDASCGSDFVADTPTQQTSNGQCPSFPHVTCSNGPNGDMFMNYMDYVDDACMQMFSLGQKTRMIASLTTTRANLLTNTNFNCTSAASVLSCDTISNYSASNSLVVYRTTDVGQPGTGYIAGTNSYDDIGFAEKFNPLQPLQKIYGALIGFGKAYGFSNASFNVKLWKADGLGGNPGTVLATIPVTLGQIIPDINQGKYSTVNFNSPVSVTSAYYVGIEFNPLTLDSIALYSTINGQISTGKAYEEYDDGTWYPFTDAINSWGVNVSLAIAPVICIDYTSINESKLFSDDILIFPNPSNGTFYIESQELENEILGLKVYNSIGALLLNENTKGNSSSRFSIDLSQHPQGLYLVEIKTKEHTIIKKISLNQ